MRLAIHVGSRVWGGAERATGRLAAALHQRGHQVVMLCNDPTHLARFAQLGLDSRTVPLRGDVMLPDALRLARVLRALRPDAFVIATFRKLWLAGAAARLARVPRAVARVGLETDTPRSAKYRFALRHLVDAVVLNSRAQAPAFLALPGWDQRRVHVIYNYLEPLPPGSPGCLRQQLGIPADARVIGAVARLAPQKRLERLLDALALLPGVHCVLAGEGPGREALADHAEWLGVADRAHFLGHCENVQDVLALLEVFVLCSDREGMSNAMLEALAAGVPVVSTPVSGAADALEPLAGGSAPGIISSADPANLALNIGRILADDALRAGMRAAAAVRVRERFAPALVLAAWERVLQGGVG